MKIKRFRHLENYDILNFLECLRFIRGVEKDYSNNLETLVHFSETFCCQQLCLLSEKKIWLIHLSLITFKVQYVVGNMQAGYYLRFIFLSF